MPEADCPTSRRRPLIGLMACALAISALVLSGCDRAPQATSLAPPAPAQLSATPVPFEPAALEPVVFLIPDTKLSVVLPVMPEAEDVAALTEHGTIQIQLFGATSLDGRYEYVVSASENPPEFIEFHTSGGRDLLEEMSDGGMRQRPTGKLLRRDRIQTGELNGVEEELDLPAGRTGQTNAEIRILTRRRMYRDGKRTLMFQIMAALPATAAEREDFDRTAAEFLQSIAEAASTSESDWPPEPPSPGE